MINIKDENELKERIFKIRTEKEIDEMLLQSEKELANPSRELYDFEKLIINLRGELFEN